MRYPIALVLTSLIAFHAGANAQSGTFATYGSGCASANNTCVSANLNLTLRNLTGVSLFAIQANSGSTAQVVCGLELRCKLNAAGSPKTMNVWLYDQATAGGPGNILAASTMVVTQNEQINRSATFSKPVILKANTTVFVAFQNVGLHLPIGQTTGTPQTHYHSGPSWSGPFSTLAWNWGLVCCGGGKVPVISNTGVPTVNSSFSVDLSSAPASQALFLAIGFGRTSIAIGPCTLLTNPIYLIGATTDAAGSFSQKVAVPNNKALVGFQANAQFAIADSSAPLGMVLTAGGEGKVGL